MTKSHKLVNKRHKNVTLGKKKKSQHSKKCNKNVILSDKKSQTDEKRHKNVNLGEKKSQHNEEK